MAQIPGAVNLTGMIAPTDSQDVYPTHASAYGLGGYREVANQSERDAIPLQRRTHGMMVFQQSDGKIYQLGSGLTNSDWSEFVLTSTTDDLAEGSTNLYYTDARVDARIPTNLSEFTNDVGFITSETDSQTLTFSSPNLSISNGNTVDLSALLDDTDTTYTAGSGLDLTGTTFSIDNTVALKSELFSGSYTDLTNKPTNLITDFDLEQHLGDSSIDGTIGNTVISRINSSLDLAKDYTDDEIAAIVIPTVPTNVSAFTNDSGYLTSYTETDPIFTASDAAGITSIDIGNWNTAYGWGDHSVEGYATETYVNTAVANVVDTAPATLDTLNELAAALGDDPNFATTITNSIATKASITDLNTKVSKSGDTMSGNLTFGNNNKLTLGNFNALQMYATGTNSLIFNNIGDLYFYNNVDDRSIIFRTDNGSGGTANYIIANGATGSVELTHYGTEKFKTTSGGGELTGNLVLSAAPTANDHAVRKDYVDNAVSSVNTTVGNLDTDDVSEGSSNLYYTDARVDARIPTNVSAFTNDSGYITSYTDTTYTAGTGLDLTGTTFSIDNTVALKSELFSGDYGDLTNKPTIPTVPTNISSFTNDSGYITSYTDTTYTAGSGLDLTGTTFSVDSTIAPKTYVDTAISNLVNGASAAFDTLKEIQDAMATDAELATAIGNLVIPTDVSDLTDTTNLLEHFSGDYDDLTNKPSLFDGDYNSLTNKPTIPTVPTNISAFTNDSGYITSYTDTTYSQATNTTLGLVKIGYNENGKNYPVELSNGQMFVNVPWTDTNTDTDNYVDSVAFNSTNGILTLGRTGALSDLTVDLDGRYLTSYTDTNDIDYINSASFNTTNGVLTLSGVGNAGATVDLDGRYQLSGSYLTAESDTLASVTGRGATTSVTSTFSGGINVGDLTNGGITGSNYNITGVNAITINDPGEGIIWGGGTNTVTLYNIDDANDNIMNFSGAAELRVNNSKVATETYVNTQVANLVDTAPTALDTLNELAAALGDDPNFATTVSNQIGLKQDAATALTTSTQFGGDVSGTYNNIVVANDSHSHSNYVMGDGTNNGALTIVSNDADFIVQDTTDSITNFIWRDHSANELKLGTPNAVPTLRATLNMNSNNITNGGTITASMGRFTSNLDASATSTGHAFQAGPTNSTNIIIDGNEIIARNNGALSPLYIQTDGQATVFGNNTVNKVSIDAGEIVATGDVCAYGTVSDRRQKENVLKLENALDKVNQLSGYTFNYIGKEDRMTGVMAQEVAEVLPEAVFETKAFGAEESTMAVRHGNMVGLLIEAIKELTEQNRQMAEEIKQLKNKP